MSIGFGNLKDHIIPMDNFGLKWHFTEERYDRFSEKELHQLKPLDEQASIFLSDYITANKLHEDFPFKTDLFNTLRSISIDGSIDVKDWLLGECGDLDKEVYLSWDSSLAMIIPFKLLALYPQAFFYKSSDDLTVIDESLDWAILFFHTGDIFFGKK